MVKKNTYKLFKKGGVGVVKNTTVKRGRPRMDAASRISSALKRIEEDKLLADKQEKDLELLEKNIEKVEKPISKKKEEAKEIEKLRELFEKETKDEKAEREKFGFSKAHDERLKARRKRRVQFQEIPKQAINQERMNAFIEPYSKHRLTVSGLERELEKNLKKRVVSELRPIKEHIKTEVADLTKEKNKLQRSLRNTQSRQRTNKALANRTRKRGVAI